jgi:hypothetical protein
MLTVGLQKMFIKNWDVLFLTKAVRSAKAMKKSLPVFFCWGCWNYSLRYERIRKP